MIADLYVLDSFHLKLLERSVRCRMKCDFNMGVLPYGMWWRKHRKSFHEYFHMNAVSKYLPIQRREVHAFLRRLLDTPDNFLHHIQQ